MKKCARCDFEYDDAYDGCPRCAEAAPKGTKIALIASSGRVITFDQGFFDLEGVGHITVQDIRNREQAHVLVWTNSETKAWFDANYGLLQAPQAAVARPAVQGSAAGTVEQYGPGSAGAAILALLAMVGSVVFISGALAGLGPLVGPVIALGLWGVGVYVDAGTLRRPVPRDYKIAGSAGIQPGLWAVLVVGIAIVGVPAYFYTRPKIKRAWEMGEALARQADRATVVTRKQRVWPAVLILVAAMIGALMLGSSVPGGTSSATSAQGVTLSQYQQVANGMSLSDVESVLGGPGEELSRSDVAGISTAMYSWQNNDGSNMNVMVQDGQVVQKAQFGLK